MVVPELFGRVSLLDKDDQVVAQLGDDAERIRRTRSSRFAATRANGDPDDLSIRTMRASMPMGNIFVAEWVATGRVTKLRRLT